MILSLPLNYPVALIAFKIGTHPHHHQHHLAFFVFYYHHHCHIFKRVQL